MSQTKGRKYKLTYFNARGVAELVRLAFAAADKVDSYEDVRVEKEKWEQLKKTMPMQAMPVLEVDGEIMCQSGAIARFVAKELGLMGKTRMDEFRIDEIFETMSELFSKHLFKMFGETDETTKKGMAKKFMDENLDVYLKYFQSRFVQNKSSKFFVGNELTLADLVVYRGLEMAGDVLKSLGCELAPKLEGYKDLNTLCKLVPENRGIAAWIKKRPVTAF